MQTSHPLARKAAPVDLKDLLGKRQSGGYVMVNRHERTALPSRPDVYSRDPGSSADRNPSLTGSTRLRLSKGEIGVLKISDDDAIGPVDQFMGNDLSPYARQLTQKVQ